MFSLIIAWIWYDMICGCPLCVLSISPSSFLFSFPLLSVVFSACASGCQWQCRKEAVVACMRELLLANGQRLPSSLQDHRDLPPIHSHTLIVKHPFVCSPCVFSFFAKLLFACQNHPLLLSFPFYETFWAHFGVYSCI